MKQFVSKVTVTGADDSIRPETLIEIAAEFPFVEFGILLSRNAMGKNRFPSKEWLRQMIAECSGRGIQFSGHICGAWVREILAGKWPKWDFYNIHDSFISPDVFKRWQINTHAQPHNVDFIQLPYILLELEKNEQSVIFQYDDVNTELVSRSVKAKADNVSALFDLSHGAGILPSSWPKPIEGVPCGYAGGLSPENVSEQLSKLESAVGDSTIWIDAETKLRSADDQVFDIEKVRAFLAAAKPRVIPAASAA